ncbi:MAG: methylmalonyl-CoA mutase small subunit [Porphyromonadaceae bacterium CG2_30_38_12]|nr:MAG: methylmalonyl-CoA mutase small subunit [Porphyromonadaceae bacterium CG2_30_38_12]
MAEKKLNLFTEFPSVTTQQWMDKITADLKGADFDKRLVWKTNEGFAVKPFYRAEDIESLKTTDVVPGKFPYVRGTKPNNDWYVRQDIEVTDVKQANAVALDVLCKGATSLGFKLQKKDLSSDFIATLLKNIAANCVELNFSICVSRAADLASILTDYFKSQNIDTSKLEGSINFDPMNRMLLSGKELSKEDIFVRAKATIQASLDLPKYRVIGVNAITLSNAGAFDAQELGYALAWGNQYLSMMIEAGIEPSIAAKKIKFNFGVGGNYFMEIAKFRAAKLLWANVVDAYQPKCLKDTCSHTVDGFCKCAAKMYIHAETSTFNKTIFDANVNMLRTQTEAMSATLGGVNSLTVTPYDATYKTADEFSERIARNQQLLLKEECHFDKVADPAAGSYYIETLTNELAAQAWKLFLDVEDNGGFFDAITSGSAQKVIKSTASNRLKAVSSRREVLLGTNQFPNFNEVGAAKITFAQAADCGCDHSGTEKLLPVRGATEFEALRFATEAAAKRPKAFMLTIGNLNMRLARAQFSCNFFACAGYEVIDNLGFKTVEEGVSAALEANANIIVLCSSDDEYAELAPAAYEVSKGKAILVVAGAPACADELRAIGIEHFVNVKSNVLETLKGFNSKLF